MPPSATVGIQMVLNGARAVMRGLEQVNTRGANIARTFDGIGRLVPFGSILKTAGLASAALGGVAAAGIAAGVRTAASMEQANIAFTTMLGSGEAAQAFLTDLQAFAAATPFEFPELQSAASSLISAGIAADDVIPIMTSLGDATAGMGTGSEGIQRATVALQQMSAAGKISGEDLAQLRDAGIPVFDLLTAATGKTKAEIAEMAQSGKLGANELEQLMAALKSGAGLERFSGLMDKQSESLSGLAATFQDTINMGLANTVQPLIPLFKTLLGSASTLAALALPAVAAGFQSFVDSAMPTVERVNNGVLFLTSNVDAIRGHLSTALSGEGLGLANLLGTAFQLSPETVTNLANFINTAVAGFQGILTAMAPVWAGIQNAPVSVLGVLQSALAWMAENPALVQAMASALTTVVFAITAIRAAVIAWTAVQTVLNFVLSANPIGLIILAIAALVGGLIVAYQKSETFRGIVDFLWTSLKQVWDVIVQVAKAVGDFIIKFTPLGALITTVRDNWDSITKVIGWFVDKLKDAWDWAKKVIDVVSDIGSAGGGIGDILSGGLSMITGRAVGGPVTAGNPYIVGEGGRELFVPSVSGNVIPAARTQEMLSAAGAGQGQMLLGDVVVAVDNREIGRAALNGMWSTAARK